MPPQISSKKTPTVTHETIVRDVRAGKIAPIYYLMGEETYYIDRIADFLLQTLLTPDERDFNLITFFGSETDIDTVISAARGYPMGAARLVVVVKEAQALAGIERLEYYCKQVQPSTVLVFCHMHGSLDRRKKIATLIENTGVLYESKLLYEKDLPGFIEGYLRRKGAEIERTAAMMMAEHVGVDLNRMAGELDKLTLILPAEGRRVVTPELVERHVGISKEYNVFELQDALVAKDVLKANRIVAHFAKNPKANPIQKILPALFRFYAQLMLAYYAPDKSPAGLAAWLGMNEWAVKKNIVPAMQRYSGVKVMNIMSEIRITDARSKGVGNSTTSDADLMKELLYFILH